MLQQEDMLLNTKFISGHKLTARLLLLCAAVLLFMALSIGTILAPQAFSSPDTFSKQLMEDSLERYSRVGDADLGGFMIAFEEEVHIAAVKEVLGARDQRPVYPYISNYSAQYEMGRFLIDKIGLSATYAYRAMTLLAIGGAGFSIGLILLAVWRDFGRPHALAVLVPFLGSLLFLQRSESAYWQIYLSLMPFAWVMISYPMLRTGWKFAALLISISALIFIKSLTGYEYLTCITISCMAPVLFHEIRSFGYTKRGLSIFATKSVLIGISCVIGFAFAVVAHINKMTDFFGSRGAAVDALVLISEYSVLQSDSGIRGEAPGVFGFAKQLIMTFFVINALVNITLILGVLWARFGHTPQRSRISWNVLFKDYLASPLFGATVLAMLASVSWSVVMIKHAFVHPHLNWVQNYLCFYIFAWISLAQLIFGNQRDDRIVG